MRRRMYHDDHQHDSHPEQRPPRAYRRNGAGHGRGRGGGRRAERGAVAQSILVLLGEGPAHGYELITTLEERSGGRWRPSPGAIYPALRKLVERDLITASEHDGKTRYELTDKGRQWAAGASEVGYTEPWAQAGAGRRGDLHRALGELAGPVRQIARFGTPEQARAAEAALKEATSKLYAILADPPRSEPTSGPDAADPA